MLGKKTTLVMFVSLGTIFVGLLLVFGAGVHTVQAQDISTSPSQSCISCHEDLYYLHDTGKWLCIVENTDRCVNCHAGDPEAYTEDEAHLSLVADPLSDGGKQCQTCHENETQTYIDIFVEKTGYVPPIKTAAYIPVTPMNHAAFPLLDSVEHETPSQFIIVALAALCGLLWLALRQGL